MLPDLALAARIHSSVVSGAAILLSNASTTSRVTVTRTHFPKPLKRAVTISSTALIETLRTSSLVPKLPPQHPRHQRDYLRPYPQRCHQQKQNVHENVQARIIISARPHTKHAPPHVLPTIVWLLIWPATRLAQILLTIAFGDCENLPWHALTLA